MSATGGGKPEYIPPDDVLDKVAILLGPTCTGYSVAFGGDATVDEVDTVEEVKTVDEAVVDILDEPVLPALSHTPTSKFFFSSVASKGKLKRQTLADEVKMSIKEKNKAILNAELAKAEYYTSKRKREEEMHELKKKKLELAIQELERNSGL